jgi:hypothetical protein
MKPRTNKAERIERDIEIERFIRDYLKRNYSADVVDALFHDEFTKRFGGRQIFKNFGAMPNLLAMRWLKRLYSQGILERGRISLTEHEVGFPNWVYSYTLNERKS